MKAMIQREYGPPEVLKLEEVDNPVVSDNGVLVRVHAASVHAGDWHLMRGTPFFIRLIFGGLRQPAISILGSDMAGRVEAVGKDVTQFQPGDEVFGDLSKYGFGAFAEYVCAPEDAFVHKPANVSFEVAAAVPVSALAALQGLRDVGQVQPGDKVLVNGASGGVGSFAVQIAKTLGAEVTGVCSTQKMEMVRSLGADHVIDYTQVDVTRTGQQYDLILDAAAYRPFHDFLSALTPDGTYVMVGGSTPGFFQVTFLGPLVSKVSRRKVKFLASNPNHADLMLLRDLLESGKISPFLDCNYDLSEVPDAIRRLEQRQVQGKVTITVC